MKRRKSTKSAVYRIAYELVVAIEQVKDLAHFSRSDEQEQAAGFPVVPGLRTLTFGPDLGVGYAAGMIRLAGVVGWSVKEWEMTGEGITVRWERIDCTRGEGV